MSLDTNKKSKKRKNNHTEENDHSENGKSKKKKTIKQCEDLADKETFQHPEEDVVENVSPKKNTKEVIEDNWSKEDYKELIRQMEEQIPKNDVKSFNSRSENLNWNQIHVGPYSSKECYEKWRLLKGKVRHFRLLSEVLNDLKTWVQNPWSASNNKKKIRHPDQPSKPLSSFMLFYMDKKEKIIRKHPEMKLTDVSRMLGEKYKTLSEERKLYYIEKAKTMQEEYKQNLSKFYEEHPEMMKESKKVNKKPVSNKPLPPFKLYLREKLKKHENEDNFNQHSLTERYKETWKSLTFKKKAFWIKRAKEEEDKFLEHLNEEPMGEENLTSGSYKSVISKEESAILDKLAGKPEKPPNSAYSLFSTLLLQGKDKTFSETETEPKNRMREIANKWKEVPEEQKRAYAEEVKHMHENYKLEFANYLESLPEDKKAEELAKLQPKRKMKRKTPKKIRTQTSLKEKLCKREPEKPPVTAWDLFKNEFIKKHSGLSSEDAFKQAADMWKNLSKKEIEKYKNKHEHLKNKYMTDYSEFLSSMSEKELKQFSKLKKSTSEAEANEDSLEEESSEEDDEHHDSGSSKSSEESDSGVSEEGY